MADQLMEHIGKRLRHYRLQQDLSQEEFARKAKVPLGRYQEIEKGKVNLRVDTLKRLVKVAGVHAASIVHSRPTVEEFFNNGEETPKWILEIFERLNQEALAKGEYWMTYLVNEEPGIGDIMRRMIESELRARS